MNQVIYNDCNVRHNEARILRERNIRRQCLALKDTLMSFVIGSVLGTWMNSWNFDMGVALAIFIVVYYVMLYKKATDAGVLGAILTICVAIVGLDLLMSRFKTAYTIILLAFGLFPFVKGLVVPVVKLCQYAMPPAK